jgi:hypothetical protein
MLKVAIGHSDDVDTGDAIEAVLEQCRDTLNGLSAQAGLLFSSIDQDFELILDKINETYPGIELIGCSTDGEFSSTLGFAEDSLALTLFHSDECEWKAGVGYDISKDPLGNLEEAVKAVMPEPKPEPKLCIVTPDSLTASGDSIVEGLRKQLGDNIPILGGTAGDQLRIKKTYQFYKDQVLSDSAPFLLFFGPILLSFGVESGWKPVGEKGKVTRVENNILYQIDDKPATEYYQHYLKIDLSEIVSEYPLAVYVTETENFYLRNPLYFNQEDGSISFLGDIPLGASVQITHVDRDGIINATGASIAKAQKNYPGTKPSIAVCFSCAGRKLVLGTRAHEEFELLQKNYSDLKVIGFYAYGEIAPFSPNTPSRFHNETFISLLIGEE